VSRPISRAVASAITRLSFLIALLKIVRGWPWAVSCAFPGPAVR